jgi:hypothetical protein
MACGGGRDENVKRGVMRRVTPYIRQIVLTITHVISYTDSQTSRYDKRSHASFWVEWKLGNRMMFGGGVVII